MPPSTDDKDVLGDRVIIEDMRARTGQRRMENIYRERRLLAWSSDVIHTTAGSVSGGSGIQLRTRSAKDKLERHTRRKMYKDWEETETVAFERQR